MRGRCVLVLLLCACGRAPEPAREANPLEGPPVDSARVGPVEAVVAWGHRRELPADLDGDGSEERVVVAADVEVREDGTALWEDGHRWVVYAESAAGERTFLYGAFVPNGAVEVAVLGADSGGERAVLVEERTPQQLATLVVRYLGSGQARSVSGEYHQVEAWLPGPASLPAPPAVR